MKKIATVCAAVLVLLFTISCGTSNPPVIGKNVDPDVTNLADARTYDWTTDIDRIPESRVFVSLSGVYVFNNESARKKIKEAIEHELNARGYEMKVTEGEPGMLVSFFVLEQADSLRRTNGYITVQGEAAISEDNVEWVPVQPGTLIVNLTDSKTDKMVWQGFASGIIKPEDVNDEVKIRQAVSSVFSRFNFDATGNK